MTGDKSNFINLKYKDGGNVTFGDDAKGKVIGIGQVGMIPSPCINDVYLVNGLKHNLLSISQLCDNGHEVVFKEDMCIVKILKSNDNLFIAHRTNNVYTINFDDLHDQNVKCLSAFNETSWLWHIRLGHVNMEQLHILSKNDLLRGLPKTKYVRDKLCDACQLGKQRKSSFKKKKGYHIF